LRLRPRDLTGIFVTFWTAVYNLRAAFVKFIEDLNMGRRTACSTGETVPVVVRYRVSDLEAWLNSCAMETAD